jgi:uncharacterized membrane protein YgdD (TMEM256/DUF423 family)
MTSRGLLLAGVLASLAGVAAGAFGAHGLSTRLTEEMLSVFETGVRYQMYHGLALVALAPVAARWPDPLWAWAGGLFAAGILVFSGSLYVLALTGVRWLGAVTPFGGAALLAGWAVAGVAAWRAVG